MHVPRVHDSEQHDTRHTAIVMQIERAIAGRRVGEWRKAVKAGSASTAPIYFTRSAPRGVASETMKAETEKRSTVLYSGRVQGVGFRYTTRSIARKYQVSGFVRNLPDGRVELVAEGAAHELEAFLGEVRE